MTKDPTSRVIPCPRCRKSTRYDKTNPHRPFCSAHCKDDDIVAWAEEEYRMPGEPADSDEIVRSMREGSLTEDDS